MRYSVLGINSGLGVSLYPFKENVIGNVECRGIFHTPKNEQWVLNFDKTPLRRDLTYFLLEKPDVVISSPDCGSGSVLRYSRAKKLGDHKSNKSLLMFFEGIEKLKPKFFYFENLPTLFKSFPKKEWEELLGGYKLIEHIVPVSKFGNSQVHRKRLVVIGIREDIKTLKLVKSFKKFPKIGKLKNCGELYGDLDGSIDPKIGHVREELEEIISIYGGKKMSLRQIRNHWLHNPEDNRWHIRDGSTKFSTAPGVYRNFKNGFPSTARKANRQFDHRGLTLTPRQLARVQGVSDSFEIYIDPNRVKYWINKGRTVITKSPPMDISVWFKRKLDRTKKLELW